MSHQCPGQSDDAPAPTFAPRLPQETALCAPDGSPAVEIGDTPVSVDIPPSALGKRGTIAFWFKLPKTIRLDESETPLIKSPALAVSALERGNCIQFLLAFGPAMLRSEEESAAIRGLLTHLKGERWYHVAFTWDGDSVENHFILDGMGQGTPEPRAKPGVVTGADPGGGAITMSLGSSGVTVTAPVFWDHVVPAESLEAKIRAAGHPRYDDEGMNYTDEALSIDMFPDKTLLYETDFDDPSDLNVWVREGGESATVANGCLKLQTGPAPGEGQHIVFWLNRDLPADFLAEWTLRPYDKQYGLTIVFFNARGRNGEDIFDPNLPPRDGEFQHYHSGALDNYHISYYAGHRGSANLRRNYGFHLAAIGVERVHTAPPETFHTITLLKQGGRVRLAVDGKVSVKFDDDGETYGPVHNHPGRLALRQMMQAWYTEYEYFRAWALE